MHKIELATTKNPNEPSSENLNAQTKHTTIHTTKAVDENSLTYNNGNSMASPFSKLVIIFSIVAITAGVATGFGGYKLKMKAGGLLPSPSNLQRIAEEGKIKAGDVFGVADEKTFKDSAEGYLEAGGIDGEGSHKLVRVGGVSQTVYLTSSITDLDKFIGMDVKIWGETFKGQKAGWLMDVGRIEVVNPDSQTPVEE
ncbi:hypothetical protein KJ707_00855 [Patescibacteria group bacterium]|nr:hypothetical protein [Patescibacteria group bacterium]MBU1967487.1 hypothetical protein [Patescibacteria group bacterium]MBU2543102.1 hypothetical protein [Patescibacteria group bacterium]